MKTFYYYIMSIIFLVAFSSCDWKREIKYDEDTFPPQLVVNCYFTPDSVWKVNITKSKLMWDEAEVINVPNASVNIYDGSTLIETLPYVSNGNYRSTTKKPEYEVEYTLEVKVEGFEMLTAKASVPTKPNVSQLFLDSVEYKPQPEYSWTMRDFKITFMDEINQNNFYNLTLIGKRKGIVEKYIGSAYVTYDTIYYEELFYTTVDPVFTNDYGTRTFSDELFDGNEYTIRSGIADYNISSSGDTLTKVIVYFEAISEDYYLFKNSSSQTAEFTEPQNRYTNIKNGLGIFAGYSTYIDSVDILN